MTLYANHLWVHFTRKFSGRDVSVNLSNVEFVEGTGTTAKLHLASGKTLALRESLADVQACIAQESDEFKRSKAQARGLKD